MAAHRAYKNAVIAQAQVWRDKRPGYQIYQRPQGDPSL